MREATFTTLIDRPIEAVWDFIADPANDPLWHREVRESSLLRGEPGHEGARYRERFEWNELGFEATLEVLRADRPHRVTIGGDELGYRIEARYELSSEGGKTRVDATLLMQMVGTLQLVAPFAWSIASSWATAALASLDEAMGAPAKAGAPTT